MIPSMKARSLCVLSVLFVVLAGCKSSTPKTAMSSAPNPRSMNARPRQLVTAPSTADFDFYLLSLSWSPEYCYSHGSAPECAAHDTFVLHGLWPQNASGRSPENCSSAAGPADPSTYKDIYPDSGLLEHEWRTHGTCSGLSADDFFNAARAAYQAVKIPPELSSLNSQISMTPDQILGLFAEANPAIPRSGIAMTCGNNYLTAVEVCFDKSLHPIACSGVRSCRANTVRIPSP